MAGNHAQTGRQRAQAGSASTIPGRQASCGPRHKQCTLAASPRWRRCGSWRGSWREQGRWWGRRRGRRRARSRLGWRRGEPPWLQWRRGCSQRPSGRDLQKVEQGQAGMMVVGREPASERPPLFTTDRQHDHSVRTVGSSPRRGWGARLGGEVVAVRCEAPEGLARGTTGRRNAA